MKKIVIIVVLCLLGGGIYYSVKNTSSPQKKNASVKVVRGDLKIEVNSYGTFHAKNSLKITSGLPGSNKITYLIEEGSKVQKGDVLARFEETKFITQIEELDNKVLRDKTETKTRESDFEIGVSEEKDRIEKAELELRRSQMLLEKYTHGDQPLEERNFKIVRDQSKLEYMRKKDRFDQLPKLLEEGFVTQIEYETEELSLRSSKITMESDQLKLDLYLKYTKPQGDLDKRNAVSNAINALSRIKKRAEAREDSLRTKLVQAKRSLSISEKKLEEWQENLKKCTLLSPASGIIIYGDPKHRKQTLPRENDSINDRSTLFTLPDLSRIEVATLIHESEIELIKLGQNCSVSSDSSDRKSYSAKISKIATVANSGSWMKGGDIKEFSITLELDDENPVIRPGTSARVVIHVDNRVKVLMVPTYSLLEKKEGFFCRVQEAPGEARLQKVSVGKHSISFTEITEGLSEGETILLYD